MALPSSPTNDQLLKEFLALPLNTIRTVQSNSTLKSRLAAVLKKNKTQSSVQKAWLNANNQLARNQKLNLDPKKIQELKIKNPQLPSITINPLTLTIATNPLLKPASKPKVKIQETETQETKQEVPVYTPLAAEEEAPEVQIEDVDKKTIHGLEGEMNNLKSNYFSFYEKNAQDHNADYFEKAAAEQSTENLFNLVRQLRLGLLPYLGNQALKTATLEALGPLGSAFRAFESTKGKLTPGQRSLLNPNAIFNYMRGLPEQQAFKLLLLPLRAGFKIFARGGGPFTKVITTTNSELNPASGKYITRVVKKDIISPFYHWSLATHKAASKIDTIFDNDTLTSISEDRKKFKYNKDLNLALSSYSSTNSKESKKKLFNLINKHDGYYRSYKDKGGKKQSISKLPWQKRLGYGVKGFGRAVFKKTAKKTAKNLRRGNIAVIFGGLLWNISIGLAANIIRVGLTKVVTTIPQLQILRAQISKFLNSSEFISTLEMSGINTSHFLRSTISSQAIGSGFLGYRLGSLLSNTTTSLFGTSINLVGGAVGASTWGLGTLYNHALRNATTGPYFNLQYGPLSYRGLGYTPKIMQWTKQYLYGDTIQYRNFFGEKIVTYRPTPLAHQPQGLSIAKGGGYGYTRNFKPGPLTRYANWLTENPYHRLPLTGAALGNFFAPILESAYGINPIVTQVAFPLVDYLWQIKGTLFSDVGRAFLETAPGGWLYSNVYVNGYNWIQGIFYDTYAAKIPFQEFTVNVIKPIPKPWFKTFSNYFSNFFNPGFFGGFALIQPLIAAGLNPIIAAIAAPIIGSNAFMLGTKLLSNVGAKLSVAKLTSLSWVGMTVGITTQLIASLVGISLPAWWVAAWSIGLPVISALIPAIGTFFSLAGHSIALGVSTFVGSIFGAATGLATQALFYTIAGSLGVITLTAFAAFVIVAGFWSPVQQFFTVHSPQSSHMSIQTTANTTQTCSKIDITADIFTPSRQPNVELTFEIDPFFFVINEDLNESISASRKVPGSTQVLAYIGETWETNVAPDHYGVKDFPETDYTYMEAVSDDFDPNLYPSIRSSLNILDLVLAPYSPIESTILEQLVDYPQFKSLQTTVKSILEMIKQLYEDGIDNTLVELSTQLELLENFESEFSDIPPIIKSASKETDLEDILYHLNTSQQQLEEKQENNPFQNLIDSPSTSCIPDDQACLDHQSRLLKIYKSWPGLFSTSKTIVRSLISQANRLQSLEPSDPTYQDKLNQLIVNLETDLANMTGLFESIEDQVDSIGDFNNLIADLDIDLDFYNLVNDVLSLRNLSELDLATSDILEIKMKDTPFKDFFNDRNYLIPKNTTYNTCVSYVYVGPPNTPHTICSQADVSQENSLLWGLFLQPFSTVRECATFTP